MPGMEPSQAQASGFPPAAMARINAAADQYDPEAKGWPALKRVWWLYRIVCVRKVVVSGGHHSVPGPRIIVGNHARAGDGFLLAFVVGQFHALTQAESFTLPFFGKLLARGGQIPVIPGRGREALDRAKRVLARGGTILVYPEGRLSHGGEMWRGKTGAARLAFESGAPLQPIAVHVDERHCRTLHGHFYDRPTVGVWQVGGPAYVSIGEPWYPFVGQTTVVVRDLRRATDEIMARVRSLLELARCSAG